MSDTGNQATIAFGTTGFTAGFSLIGGAELELGKLEDSDLSTSGYKTFIPDDLADPGEFDAEFTWAGGDTPPPLGTVETITITHPTPSGASSGATHAGTGFIRKLKMPDMQNGQIQKGRVTVCWDGKTGPTYTPAA